MRWSMKHMANVWNKNKNEIIMNNNWNRNQYVAHTPKVGILKDGLLGLLHSGAIKVKQWDRIYPH